jgi:hypothetical protein
MLPPCVLLLLPSLLLPRFVLRLPRAKRPVQPRRSRSSRVRASPSTVKHEEAADRCVRPRPAVFLGRPSGGSAPSAKTAAVKNVRQPRSGALPLWGIGRSGEGRWVGGVAIGVPCGPVFFLFFFAVFPLQLCPLCVKLVCVARLFLVVLPCAFTVVRPVASPPRRAPLPRRPSAWSALCSPFGAVRAVPAASLVGPPVGVACGCCAPRAGTRLCAASLSCRLGSAPSWPVAPARPLRSVQVFRCRVLTSENPAF